MKILKFNRKDNSAKYAFTLAEVLVTLGIIGVVSAMTLPTLVKNHQRQVYVTQLKKVASMLSQGAEKAIFDNNAISLVETKYNSNNETGARDFFNDNFKVIKNCDNYAECFPSEYKLLDGSASDLTWGDGEPSFILADGTAVHIELDAMNRVNGFWGLYIDINGSQGPNIVGRDFFYAVLNSDGTVNGADVPEFCGVAGTWYSHGAGCFEKIVEDGWQMNY